MVEIGIKGHQETTVTVANVATNVGSIGTHVDVSHCAAIPMGMKVWAETERFSAIVTTHMMLQAWELGIGSCWIGAFSPMERIQIVKDALDVCMLK